VLRQWHGHTAVINSVALLQPDADVLATASYDATVCLWDGRSHSSQPIQILKDAKDSVTAVHISSSGDNEATIRTAAVDGCVRTYDIRRGVMQCDDYGSPITSLAFSNTSNMQAVSCLDGSIRVGPVNDNVEGTFAHGMAEQLPVAGVCRGKHTAGRYGLECCFSADSSVVVTGSEDGRGVLYDCQHYNNSNNNPTASLRRRGDTPVLAAELVGHVAPTCSVAAHPDESDVMITASYDGNGVVWASSRNYMRWDG